MIDHSLEMRSTSRRRSAGFRKCIKSLVCVSDVSRHDSHRLRAVKLSNVIPQNHNILSVTERAHLRRSRLHVSRVIVGAKILAFWYDVVPRQIHFEPASSLGLDVTRSCEAAPSLPSHPRTGRSDPQIEDHSDHKEDLALTVTW